MQAEIRPARPDEMSDYGAIAACVCGAVRRYSGQPGLASTRPDWTLCAFVDGRMVTTFATIPFTARFNGRAVKLGGVSGIGTLPEYRRQDLMRPVSRLRIVCFAPDTGRIVRIIFSTDHSAVAARLFPIDEKRAHLSDENAMTAYPHQQ